MDLPVVDKEDALGRLDGDVELWAEICAIWLDDAVNLLAAVHTALDARSADGLRRAAHALKGSSANVGALRVVAVARDVERDAPQSDWVALEAGVQKLSEETESARVALSRG
jgi:HPt (histidine-containing phosphotransfer) domain-containing protein